MLEFQHILVHYHEIALKGRNRVFFEQKLVDNIKNVLGDLGSARRLTGRILVELKDNPDEAADRLRDVFGISSYSPTLVVKTDLKEMRKGALEIIKEAKGKTFKIETKRSYKQFPKNSMEISSDIGAYILKHKKLKVDVKKPKIRVNIEVLKDKTFIYTEKIKGPGGLPVGVSGKMLVLISGGIDSPVASYLMLKRGCELDFLHFHSYPFTDKASIEKVEELLGVLDRFSGSRSKNGTTCGRLYSVPIIDFQKEVVKKTDAKYRIILYRRLMYKAAEKIAEKCGAQALVSGDSLGQVASQTIENISAISHGIDMPIMRPLIGFDKEEIIQWAKKIGTFDISIEPHGDCCSIFLPKSPATKAKLENILREEKNIGMTKWVNKIVKEI